MIVHHGRESPYGGVPACQSQPKWAYALHGYDAECICVREIFKIYNYLVV